MSSPIITPNSTVIKTDPNYKAVTSTSTTWNSGTDTWNGTWEWSGDALLKNQDKPKIR